MFFSVMPKLVLTFVFVKFYFYLFSFELRFFSIYLFICGFLSLIIGIYNAMFQNNLKRFFAYSSIVNVGFILISFSIMDFNGFFSGLFFLFCYLFSIILIFYLILNYRQISLKEFNTLFDLSLLNNSSNLILYIFSLIFLSFAGIPPLIGFFGKFFVFFSLFNSFNYLILLLLLLLSVISGFYYLRIIRFIFFSKVFEYVYFNFYNNSYLFIFIIFFNLFFIFFFDFCCEYIYFIMVKSFI
jgi:NADH-quinone oxidoreductase subunit N